MFIFVLLKIYILFKVYKQITAFYSSFCQDQSNFCVRFIQCSSIIRDLNKLNLFGVRKIKHAQTHSN